MKKFRTICAGLSFVLLFLLFSACTQSGDTIIVTQNNTTGKKEFPVTVASFKEVKQVEVFGDEVSKLPLCFLEGKEDIPYFIVAGENLNGTLESKSYADYREFEVSEVYSDSTEVVIKNVKTNSKLVFDLIHRCFTFDNYDAFFQVSRVYMNAASPLSDYLKFMDGNETTGEYCSNVSGKPVTISWAEQDIGVILAKVGDKYYLALPFQSYADIFNFHLVYNGAKLFYVDELSMGGDVDEYFSTSGITEEKDRSEALAEYCYNELCLNLDLNYGLKGIHGIEAFQNFDSYFKGIGLRDRLKSTKNFDFAQALKDVCGFYFGDGHSGLAICSPYFGQKKVGKDIPPLHVSSAALTYNSGIPYLNKRNEKYSSGIPAYEVTPDGKTAIVRFDTFTATYKNAAGHKNDSLELLKNDNELLKKYLGTPSNTESPGNLEDKYDTIAMISAVNKLIHEDSNIENVVLDLSCNGGGANHAACFVIAWMLGYCKFDFTNSITGSKWTALYKADVNFDGNYSKDDTINDKNLFCMISPYSFSCGNMVPAVLKDSNRVTILGAKSSGGTSCVYFTSAADGTIFCVSSKNVMCININGSVYNIDQGVEPHYYINQSKSFYDLNELQGIVDSINKKS